MIQMEHSVGVAKSRGPLWDYLSLFTSFRTLLCCTLPSLLVLLGMGATVAGSLISGNFIYLLAPHLRG